MADVSNVTFTDDIPTIQREGFNKGSKYTELLDACVKNAGKAARMDVNSQGQASSRASSIKNAAESHPSQVNDEGIFIVATRSNDDDTEFYVYTKFAKKGTDAYESEVESRQKRAERREEKKRKKREGKAEGESSGSESAQTSKPKKKVKKG